MLKLLLQLATETFRISTQLLDNVMQTIEPTTSGKWVECSSTITELVIATYIVESVKTLIKNSEEEREMETIKTAAF